MAFLIHSDNVVSCLTEYWPFDHHELRFAASFFGGKNAKSRAFFKVMPADWLSSNVVHHSPQTHKRSQFYPRNTQLMSIPSPPRNNWKNSQKNSHNAARQEANLNWSQKCTTAQMRIPGIVKNSSEFFIFLGFLSVL